MVAGAGAGLVSSIATCPLDVVKTTLQAQSAKRGSPGYEGVTKTCLRIYRQSGLTGFYRGLAPTIAGYLPTWGIYFTVYDFTKDRLRRVPFACGESSCFVHDSVQSTSLSGLIALSAAYRWNKLTPSPP
jgi:solute carrier family 25 folate transporter 32